MRGLNVQNNFIFHFMVRRERIHPLSAAGDGDATAQQQGVEELPPPYSEGVGISSAPAMPPPPPDTPGPAPPPYSSVTPGATTQGNRFVQCRVCNNIIHVEPSSRSRVVKCTFCHEATPVASPPPGKKYVRCPCNCLLTCSVTATRVICPRDNCKRVIGVGVMPICPQLTSDRIRVVCGCCARSILWPRNAEVAKCPHCRRTTYLNKKWMKTRALTYLVIGLVLIFLGITVTAGTVIFVARNAGIVVVYIGVLGAFIFGIGFLVRSAFYFAMTQSNPET